MTYNEAEDSRLSYDVAINAIREQKIASGEIEPWTRKEVIGDATLYLGDCLEILPTLGKVDAVVTDPPYGLGDWNNRGTNASRPFDSEVTQSWDVPISQSHIDRMVAGSCHQVFWGGNYYLDLLRRTKQMFVWNKQIRGMHFNDCELAWCSGWRAASRVFDYSPSRAETKQHPTQKPVSLMEWCVQKLPDDCVSILDPFMGSGTTGVAALNLGREFIGIEIDETYFDIACERMREALRQPRLFAEPTPKPTQDSMQLEIT